jgi:hypothetical protein
VHPVLVVLRGKRGQARAAPTDEPQPGGQPSHTSRARMREVRQWVGVRFTCCRPCIGRWGKVANMSRPVPSPLVTGHLASGVMAHRSSTAIGVPAAVGVPAAGLPTAAAPAAAPAAPAEDKPRRLRPLLPAPPLRVASRSHESRASAACCAPRARIALSLPPFHRATERTTWREATEEEEGGGERGKEEGRGTVRF